MRHIFSYTDRMDVAVIGGSLAGLQAALESQLSSTTTINESERTRLLEVLRSGELPVEASAPQEAASAAAAARL